MISNELAKLLSEYASELRRSKEDAELWWAKLEEEYASNPKGLAPSQLWPLGPVSHPWVIATYRKYYFLSLALAQTSSDEEPAADLGSEGWGQDDEEHIIHFVEPKTFVLDMLSGGDTNDLYRFILSLVFVPIGLRADEPV